MSAWLKLLSMMGSFGTEIPRTLSFLRSRDVLLLLLQQDKLSSSCPGARGDKIGSLLPLRPHSSF